MQIKQRKFHLSFWMNLFWVILFAAMLAIFLATRDKLEMMQEDQSASRFQDAMYIYADGVGQSMDSVERYLYLTMEDSADLVRIESGKKSLSYYTALKNINGTFQRILSFNSNLCDLVYYYPAAEEVHVGNSTLPYRERQNLERAVLDSIRAMARGSRSLQEEYGWCMVDNRVYITHYCKINHSYFATTIAADTLFSQLSDLTASGGVWLFLTDRRGMSVASTFTEGEPPYEQYDGGTVEIDGEEYLVNTVPALQGYFRLGTLSRQSVVYSEGRGVLSVLSFMFLALALIFFPLSILFARRFVIKPLAGLVQGMRQLGDGDFDARIDTDSPIREYCVMGDTFNRMSVEIKHLKIENYESQLRTNKAQLQYLQTQVSPHFYLNALNVIYSLAQLRDYEKIQRMTMHLVNYSRYLFHDFKELVTLEQERRHVREYLEIQKMRFGEFESFEESVEEGLDKLLVPPFVVQSFVENSVKYALRQHSDGRLSLRAERDPSGGVLLTVRDNGDGYSPEVLQAVNDDRQLSRDSEKNVGIRNVQERLRIIYGTKASVRIWNDHGAVTRICLPLILQD